jgi:outer membrane murein-binding lipoprotein Lpp
LIGCSNLEPELRKLASDPSVIIVIQDESDQYWAFSASRIKEVSKNTVTLKEGTVVAKGSGTAPADEIASTLIDLRSKANPGGFGATETNVSGTSGTINAKIDVLAQDVSVSVAKIVSPKA